MKGLVIPTSLDDELHIIELGESSLQTFYKTIGCRCIDFVTLGYADENLAIDAVIDDEGLINGSPINQWFIVSYLERVICAPLFGTIIIVITDESTGDIAELDLVKVKNLLIDDFGIPESYFPKED